MIKFIYDNYFIKGNELLFYLYISLMLIMIIILLIIGYKEIRKNVFK